MNMGLSAKHASTVPLVLNLDSGHINSQFNIVFDDWFATVAASMESLPGLNSPEWSQMFGDSTFQFRFDDEDDNDEPLVAANGDLPANLERSHNAVSNAMDKHRPAIPLPIVLEAEEPLKPAQLPILVETVDESPARPPARPIVYPPREPSSSPPRESSPRESTPHDVLVSWKKPVDDATRLPREIKQESEPTRASQPSNSSSLRRSTRSTRGQSPNRLIQDRSDPINLGSGPSNGPSRDAVANLVSIMEDNPSIALRMSNIPEAYEESPNLASNSNVEPNAFLVADQPGLTSVYELNGITKPYAYKASNSDPDTLSYDEAMADVDRELWIEAAKKEIKSLEDHGTWTEVDISEATSRILPSQWVFRRKRTPDGNVKSHKGRTVARGDLEQGVILNLCTGGGLEHSSTFLDPIVGPRLVHMLH